MPESEENLKIEWLDEHQMWWPKYDQRCERHIAYWNRHRGDWNRAIELCKERRVAIQAGGSVGVWPAALAPHFDVVYTFEPHPDIFQCLVRNCPADNVIKIQAVLGCERKPIQMRWKSIGSHWVLPDSGPFPTLILDDLNLPACDLIMLDIEGFEYYALQGMQQTIDKFSPVIQIEDKDVEYRHNLKAGIAEDWLLGEMGYKRGERVGDDRIYTRF